jgi:hypothetical protein
MKHNVAEHLFRFEASVRFALSTEAFGVAVDKASDAKESMSRLIQNNWMNLMGDCLESTEPNMATITAVVIMRVSWNCRNLQMLSLTCLPHFTADTIELKESSITKMPLWYTENIHHLP